MKQPATEIIKPKNEIPKPSDVAPPLATIIIAIPKSINAIPKRTIFMFSPSYTLDYKITFKNKYVISF